MQSITAVFLAESSALLYDNALLCCACAVSMQNGNTHIPLYQEEFKPNRPVNVAMEYIHVIL